MDFFAFFGQPPSLSRARTCRFSVLSSSDMPPDKKWMPGTAGGMERRIVRTVYLATCVVGQRGSSGSGISLRVSCPGQGMGLAGRAQLRTCWACMPFARLSV